MESNRTPDQESFRSELDRHAEILRQTVEQNRPNAANIFGAPITDAQWQEFVDFAVKEAIPFLLLGEVRGLRAGQKTEEDKRPNKTLNRATEDIGFHNHRLMLVHDVCHYLIQRVFHSVGTPRFLSGPKNNERIPTQEEIDVPFETRRYLTNEQLWEELINGAFGIAFIPQGNELIAASIMIVSLDESRAKTLCKEREQEYEKMSRENPRDPLLPGNKILIEKMKEHTANSEYTQDNAWNFLIENTIFYTRGTLVRTLIESHINRQQIIDKLQLIDQWMYDAFSKTPDEAKAIFRYIARRMPEIQQGQPVLFELFQALKNNTLHELLRD